MRAIKVDRSKNRSRRMVLTTTIDCPWETVTLAGHQTSLDSQPDREHAVFARPELVPEDIRTPFVLRGEKPLVPPTVAAVVAAPASPPPPAAPQA